MTLIKRLQDVLRSNLNALIDSMEDPQKIMDLLIVEMKEQEKKAKKKLTEIKALRLKSSQNQNAQEIANIKEQEIALQQIIIQIPERIKAAKNKQTELTKQLIKAKAKKQTQALKDLGKIAKDYVHDTAAFDTYERMTEKIENLEAYTQGLQEINPKPPTEKTAEQIANQIENQLAALKAKKEK